MPDRPSMPNFAPLLPEDANQADRRGYVLRQISQGVDASPSGWAQSLWMYAEMLESCHIGAPGAAKAGEALMQMPDEGHVDLVMTALWAIEAIGTHVDDVIAEICGLGRPAAAIPFLIHLGGDLHPDRHPDWMAITLQACTVNDFVMIAVVAATSLYKLGFRAPDFSALGYQVARLNPPE